MFHPVNQRRRSFIGALCAFAIVCESGANIASSQRPSQSADVVSERSDHPTTIQKIGNEREQQLRQLGLRVLRGQHVTIVTDLPDLPDRKEIDELPSVFDLAVPQWCEYFSIPKTRVANWRPTAYLVQDKERFKLARLFPDDLPPFLNGFQRGDEMWVYAQPSDYYLRMLFLHEGTHGFMFSVLGGLGAPWYSEGLAEYLGTHRWEDGRLRLGWLPDSKDNTPYWGRIRIIQSDMQNQRAHTFEQILGFQHSRFRQNQAYAWSWAVVTFLDGHPRYRNSFRQMKEHIRLNDHSFNRKLIDLLADKRQQLPIDWRVFQQNLDYGYNVAEDEVIYAPTRPLVAGNNRIAIQASRGWQSSGFVVQAGKRYRIAARGRFLLRQQPTNWICEPGGVTLEYHHGLPLGILMAAIGEQAANNNSASSKNRSDENSADKIGSTKNGLTTLGFTTPERIGLQRIWQASESGTLFFRINEPAGQLADNRGDVTVSVRPLVD